MRAVTIKSILAYENDECGSLLHGTVAISDAFHAMSSGKHVAVVETLQESG